MPQHLHLDFETYSEADLKAVGAYRYAYDPSTEILCAAMALGDEEPVVWTAQKDEIDLMEFERVFNALQDPNVLIFAHNANFEIAICEALLERTWGIPCPDLSRFRCTMSLAHRAALPGKLEKLAEVLGLSNLKDKRGKALLKKFSQMQEKRPSKKLPNGAIFRVRPEDAPEDFAALCDYCAQDVRVEQEVARRLAYFDDPLNNSNFTLHAIINSRGVPVNLNALRHAQKLIEEETALVAERFRALTGFEFTQNARFLGWLHADGIHLDNLQAETIKAVLDPHEGTDEAELPNGLRALRMKQSVAYVSIKKVKTMLACAGPHDNRIRGMLNHHGATTGRSTNSLVQFQNMKRPTVKDWEGGNTSEAAYRDICNGISRDMLELTYGPVLEVISSCIRHFVHDV